MQLKKQMSQLQQEIVVLKHLCASPIRSHAKSLSASGRKSLRRRTSEDFINIDTERPSVQTETTHDSKKHHKEVSEVNKTAKEKLCDSNQNTQSTRSLDDSSNQTTDVTQMKKRNTNEENNGMKTKSKICKEDCSILLLADNQGNGLVRKLIENER